MARILMWGAGAIGGTVAAFLARAGHEITAVDISTAHVDAIRARGLKIEGPVAEFTQPLDIRVPEEVDGRWDTVVLSIKAQFCEPALEQLLPHLDSGGCVVSLQNGLCEHVIRERIGGERTVGALVGFAADMLAPGRVRFSTRAKFSIGELDGCSSERIRALAKVFADFEPDVQVSENIWGDIWGKMAFVMLLYGSTLGMSPYVSLWSDEKLFPVWRALVSEITEIAHAQSILPVGIDGLEPEAFRAGAPEASARQSLAAVAERFRPSSKTHSGMWRDIAIHGRKTEAEAQLSPIIAMSRALGVAAPTIALLYRLLRQVEDRALVQDDALLDRLMAAARKSPVNHIG